MSTLNHVTLMGYLGADPELRHMPSGGAVCNFRIATTERWKDKDSGEQRESTEWHSITSFGRQAEIVAEYMHKGSLCLVQGQLRTRKWTDKNGVDRYSTEVVMRELKMINTGKRNGEEREPQQRELTASGGAREPATQDFNDDIPF